MNQLPQDIVKYMINASLETDILHASHAQIQKQHISVCKNVRLLNKDYFEFVQDIVYHKCHARFKNYLQSMFTTYSDTMHAKYMWRYYVCQTDCITTHTLAEYKCAKCKRSVYEIGACNVCKLQLNMKPFKLRRMLLGPFIANAAVFIFTVTFYIRGHSRSLSFSKAFL